MVSSFALSLTLSALSLAPAHAETLQVMGAGSLTAAFSDLVRRFPPGADTLAAPEFGPSGLMRQKIEAGATADLFASADMEQARRLAAGHAERMVIHFTRNRLCALARPALGLTTGNMLDKMLDPKTRIGTSTPGADPGGDYAWAVFTRAEAAHPGARATLQVKALKLVGGGDATPLLVPGKGAVEGVFIADRADMMLGYCSGSAAIIKEVPDLVSVWLPPELSVGPAYGMVLLNMKPVTLRFAAYVMSEPGQRVLASHGFDPVAAAEQPAATAGVWVQRARHKPALLSPVAIASLKPTTQRVAFQTGHGEEAADWTGPLLWDVLIAAKAVNPGQPSDPIRSIVHVTGADGYVASFSLAEMAPQFAGRPIQLATTMNNTALPNQALRLVVPGERRAARSVRDVVRIDID
jgi:ABC-type molybdate transport system substrate-binding protein